MAPGNLRSVHWFIGFFGIFRDLYILIRRGEGAPPGTFFSSTLPLTILPKHGGTTRFWVRNAKIDQNHDFRARERDTGVGG